MTTLASAGPHERTTLAILSPGSEEQSVLRGHSFPRPTKSERRAASTESQGSN